ncbi:hypothetical protein IWQ60_008794 [Tieghemiomyces parasiticus]|uniref:Uncharacterized protein n=1 Tax=Tieghemiomyces parasiticus TaxID=78921 RepID=A0A9W8DL02_9FUNG|nr:hypothetical protein IWQ60_008794 [Tieghemiomyces parasiticus]
MIRLFGLRLAHPPLGASGRTSRVLTERRRPTRTLPKATLLRLRSSVKESVTTQPTKVEDTDRSAVSSESPSSRLIKPKARTKQQFWTAEEDERLRLAVATYGATDFKRIASAVGTRTAIQCYGRHYRHMQRTGPAQPWSPEEDQVLLNLANEVKQAAKKTAPEKANDRRSDGTLMSKRRRRPRSNQLVSIPWAALRHRFTNRTVYDLFRRYEVLQTLAVGPWQPDETERLRQAVAKYGVKGAWPQVAEFVRTRTAQQCRGRYVNIQRPALERRWWKVADDVKLFRVIYRVSPTLLDGLPEIRELCRELQQLTDGPNETEVEEASLGGNEESLPAESDGVSELGRLLATLKRSHDPESDDLSYDASTTTANSWAHEEDRSTSFSGLSTAGSSGTTAARSVSYDPFDEESHRRVAPIRDPVWPLIHRAMDDPRCSHWSQYYIHWFGYLKRQALVPLLNPQQEQVIDQKGLPSTPPSWFDLARDLGIPRSTVITRHLFQDYHVRKSLRQMIATAKGASAPKGPK